MVNVTQASNIVEVVGEDGFADVDYGETSSDGGVVHRVQCSQCGQPVVEDEESGPLPYERLLAIAKNSPDWTLPVSDES